MPFIPVPLDQQSEEKIQDIYNFLKENEEIPECLKVAEFAEWWGSVPYSKRPYYWLHQAYWSNPLARMDYWQEFTNSIRWSDVTSIGELIGYLWQGGMPDHQEVLFEGLMQYRGWGPKTAAMASRYLYQANSGGLFAGLEIFEKVEDSFYEDVQLPVDRIIGRIMHVVSKGTLKGFDKINYALRSRYNSNEDILLWDDLWFWGWMTADGDDFGDFNEGRFYRLKQINMADKPIIRESCAEFIQILEY